MSANDLIGSAACAQIVHITAATNEVGARNVLRSSACILSMEALHWLLSTALAPSAGQQINRREPLTSRRWNHRGPLPTTRWLHSLNDKVIATLLL